MRIIAGKARGRRLFTPVGNRVRPTADRVKESVFNIIGMRMQDALVLDLFCGTGNLGLEAWSRGAASVTLVDYHKDSMQLAEKNRNLLGAKEVELVKNDVLQAVHAFANQHRVFDWVFCDPPYRQGWITRLLKADSLSVVVGADGTLVFEHDRRETQEVLEAAVGRWQVLRQAAYGDTTVSFLIRLSSKTEEHEEDGLCEE